MMCRQRAFTLIELLVVIAIIALLMAILMPALKKAKDQAQAVACQATLHQWGPVWFMYAQDNDGYLPGYASGGPEHWWPLALWKYYRDPDLRLCPSAKKMWTAGGWGTFAAWGVFTYDSEQDIIVGEFIEGYEGLYGSYGENSFKGKLSEEMLEGEGDEASVFWASVDVKGGDQIPLLLDCWFMGAFPDATDAPPEYDGEQFIVWHGDEIQRYCINRHNGYVNCLFFDWSVRKVALKELWKLRWHREFDINGPWTIAGFDGKRAACADAWDAAASWMSKFPEY